MNKKLFYTYIVAAVFLGSSGMAVAAPPDLDVVFETTPLFFEANLAPGNTVTRWIKITNNTNGAKPAQVEAINIVDTDELSAEILFEIKEESSLIYSGTLQDFFSKKAKPLSNVPKNSTVQYDFSATFNPAVGNLFQGKSVSFDLIAGFQGQVQGGNSSGGGGGGAAVPPGLSISENSVAHTFRGATSVSVTWNTSYASTSQIIYSASNEPHRFDLNAPNYGYAHSTPEVSTLTTVHALILTGLKPKTTYFYRVVSHASPASVSYEREFTTEDNFQNPTGQVAGANNKSGEFSNKTGKQSVIAVRPEGSKQHLAGKVLGESATPTPEVANITPSSEPQASSTRGKPWLFLLGLFVIVLVWKLYRAVKKSKKPQT